MQTAKKLKNAQVRLVDIANELDVSVMTVSRSLRHDTTISPQTRVRVQEVARRLGYKGPSGKTRRAENEPKVGSLGLLLRHESIEAAHRDNTVMAMVGGIMSVADQQGVRLKMHTWPEGEQPLFEDGSPAIPALLRKGGCEAAIVHGYHEEHNLNFLSHRMPVVTMGRYYRDLPISAVVADNVDGIHRIVSRLAQLGHRRLGWVGSSFTWSFMESRQAGFLQGCLQNGLEINPRFCFGSEIYAERGTPDPTALVAAMDAGVTAFVCGNDSVAMNVKLALETAGKRVPDDVSVTGFDAWGRAQQLWQLMSIDPNFFEIGKVAAQLALQRVARPLEKPCVVTVRGELVMGDSAAPPPSKSV